MVLRLSGVYFCGNGEYFLEKISRDGFGFSKMVVMARKASVRFKSAMVSVRSCGIDIWGLYRY